MEDIKLWQEITEEYGEKLCEDFIKWFCKKLHREGVKSLKVKHGNNFRFMTPQNIFKLYKESKK